MSAPHSLFTQSFLCFSLYLAVIVCKKYECGNAAISIVYNQSHKCRKHLVFNNSIFILYALKFSASALVFQALSSQLC